MADLTSKQEEILLFIKQFIKQKGYPPTIREIAEGVNLASSSTVHGHLDRLEKKGLIERHKTLPRALRVKEVSNGYLPSSPNELLAGPVCTGSDS